MPPDRLMLTDFIYWIIVLVIKKITIRSIYSDTNISYLWRFYEAQSLIPCNSHRLCMQ